MRNFSLLFHFINSFFPFLFLFFSTVVATVVECVVWSPNYVSFHQVTKPCVSHFHSFLNFLGSIAIGSFLTLAFQ